MSKVQKKSEKLEDQLKNMISTFLDIMKVKEGPTININNINISRIVVPAEGNENIISPVYSQEIKPNDKLLVEIDSTIDKKSNHIYAKLSVDKDGNVNSDYVEDDELEICPEDSEDKKSLKKRVIDTLKEYKEIIINIICTVIQILSKIS